MTMAGFVISTVCFVLFISSVNMAIFDPAFETSLRHFVEETMDCRQVPGLTLAVVKDNETWTSGFGHADLDIKRPVDTSTLFGIGSISKSFTMILLGVLMTENPEKKWSWTTKFRDIMGPEYGFSDQYRTDELTLRDMLCHRTGVSTLQDFSIFGGIPESISRQQYCKLMKLFPESLPFRDRFQYNNHMYMLLGHVAEKIGGASWESLVTSKLLQPLGMSNTRIMNRPDDMFTDRSAKPYIFKDGSFQNGTRLMYKIHPEEPAGAILSSADDMSKWLRFMLGDGLTPDGRRLIDKDLFLAARKVSMPSDAENDSIQRPEFPVSVGTSGYGYALFIGNYRGYPLRQHSGGLFSYISLMWLYPQQNIGIFASVNGHAQHFKSEYLAAIFYYISDELFQESNWINSTTSCSLPEPWKNATTDSKEKEDYVDIENSGDYVGSFGNRYMTSIDIQRDPDDEATLMFSSQRLKGRLFGTTEKDRLVLEITEPWELMTTFLESNNASIGINMTFKRENDVIIGFDLQLDTKIFLKKGVTIGDDVTNSAVARWDKCGFLTTQVVLVICCIVSVSLFQRSNPLSVASL